VGLRWEWRTFGEQLGPAGERLGSLPVEKVTESDETYLLAPASLDAVKVRAELMDVKHLEAVDDDGLELWEPVMKAPLPVSAADAAIVLAALGVPVPVPALGADPYDLAAIAAASPGVVAVPVQKTRRHFRFGGCMAELTDLRTGERSVRTIAVESEVPADVVAAVHELGLSGRENVNVPRGLAALRRAPSRTSGGRTARR
jgi:exopolyphosphatase/guanosine-5'-triphosphate,3'-diphosphate pyrophosphatase